MTEIEENGVIKTDETLSPTENLIAFLQGRQGKNLYDENYAWGWHIRCQSTWNAIKKITEYVNELNQQHESNQACDPNQIKLVNRKQLYGYYYLKQSLVRQLIVDLCALCCDDNQPKNQNQYRSIYLLDCMYRENKDEIQLHHRMILEREEENAKEQRDAVKKQFVSVGEIEGWCWSSPYAWPVSQWEDQCATLERLCSNKPHKTLKKIKEVRGNWAGHMGNLDYASSIMITNDEIEEVLLWARSWLKAFTLIMIYADVNTGDVDLMSNVILPPQYTTCRFP